jgi:hypothetical protein
MAVKELSMKNTITHDEWLNEQLKDAVFAAAYLNAASEDDDPKTYLTARGEVRRIISMRKANDRAASNLKCNTPPRVRCTDAYQYDIPTASA